MLVPDEKWNWQSNRSGKWAGIRNFEGSRENRKPPCETAKGLPQFPSKSKIQIRKTWLTTIAKIAELRRPAFPVSPPAPAHGTLMAPVAESTFCTKVRKSRNTSANTAARRLHPLAA
jgi:hypothetical protein